MANKVTGQAAGGAPKVLNGVTTVGDVRTKLGISEGQSASVNGEPEDDDFELEDYSFVSFAPQVKGG